MASKEEKAKQYAKEIIESQNPSEKIEEIEKLINGLVYEKTKKNISEEDKEYIWEYIEKELERLENKKIVGLYEQTNKRTLEIISLVKRRKKNKGDKK